MLKVDFGYILGLGHRIPNTWAERHFPLISSALKLLHYMTYYFEGKIILLKCLDYQKQVHN